MIDAVTFQLAGIIGAGVLGLPRALVSAGLWFIIPSIAIPLALILTARMIQKMLSDFNEPMQLPSLVARYLGSNWKIFVYLSIVFSIYGAIAAYIKGIVDQLSVIAPAWFLQLTPFLLILFGMVAIYAGTLFVERLGKLNASLVLFVIIFASLLNFSMCSFKPLPKGSFQGLLLFSSTLFFALFGLNVLPEVNYISKGRAATVYAIASLIALGLYILFSFSTYACLGENISDVATVSLFGKYAYPLNYLFFIFPILAMLGPFFTLGLGLRHIYQFDFKIDRLRSTLLVYIPPLLLYEVSKIFGISFLGLLSIVGEITLPLFAISIVLAYATRQLSRKEFFIDLLPIVYTFVVYISFLLLFIYEVFF